ncbi:MAG: hypothetical protein EBU49_02080 [Proteobacteria bacterium]|nr:hypothetical protein [Pseudomonadota bacterium]
MPEPPTKPPTKRRRIMMNEEEAQTRAAMWEEAARSYRDANSGNDPARAVPEDRSSITMGRHLEDLRAVDLRIRVIEGAVIELATLMGITAEALEKGKKPRSSWEAVKSQESDHAPE